MKYDCLIVDDEIELSRSTCEYFNMFDVSAAWVPDADGCVNFLRDNHPELILLDINLGASSGFDLCRKLRQTTNIPILFISARTSDDDMLLALNIGGDDYIQKPYSLSVLLAKVKAVLKRYKNNNKSENILDFGGLCIDSNNMLVTLNDQSIELKAMEYKLLLYLAQNKNRTVSKDEIFRKVWGDSITGDNTPTIKAAIDANAHNKIVFNLKAADAKDMAAEAPELEAADFMSLPRFHVYANLQSNGRSTGWLSGQTLPAPPPIRLPVELKARSMSRYGQNPAELENHLTATEPLIPLGSVGRKRTN